MRDGIFSRTVGGTACLKVFAESFLTAHAMRAAFHAPLVPAHYETAPDYVIASIYELLGVYDLQFLFLMVLSAFLYAFMERRSREACGRGSSSLWLSGFFALCLLLGQSFYEAGDSSYCIGSAVNLLKFILAFAGYVILFHSLMRLAFEFLASRSFTGGEEHFFTRNAFAKAFCIILGAYAPFLLLAFPGNLCWDAIGQIEQVFQGTYSTHHPLFHTLVMGGLVKGGQALFHSSEAGLFGYMLLQDAALAAALAGTIAVLAERKAKFSLLLCLLLLYCVTPVYSNMASTAIKDVPYSAFMVGYVICLALLLEVPGRILRPRFAIVFFLVQTGVVLFRNNGVYVVLLSGIAVFLFLRQSYDLRGKAVCLSGLFGGSVLAAGLVLAALALACDAAPGSKGEMLSIPFQQTARYLQLYREEIGSEERDAIEAVLGDVGVVAEQYNPASSDPVKALFRADASGRELAAYTKAWLRGLARHPAPYFEAFLVHVYGWFTPSVGNSIRYETEGYDMVRQGGLFPGAEKILIFYYRFASRFTLLGVLENIGAGVWALLFLVFYQKKQGCFAARRATVPLWVSLLVCMAAPGYWGHPRYAFPILFTVPFLYGFTLTLAPGRKNPARK